MELLDRYKALQDELFAYFGYVETWRAFPVFDAREMFWYVRGEGPGEVAFAKTEEDLQDNDGDYCTHEIYTQRHLPRWIYRGTDYTMIVVDTHTDGNKVLQIFVNDKERPET